MFWVYVGGRIAFQSVVFAVNAAVSMALLPVAVKLSVPKNKRKRPLGERRQAS